MKTISKHKMKMKKSLSLAELLIGVLFLLIVMSGILMAFTNCILLNESNRNLTAAVTHAQYVMEEIKNAYTLDNIRETVDTWDPNTLLGNELVSLSNEVITICCFDSSNNDACFGSCPNNDVLYISVNVDWQDRGGRARNTVLKTLVVEP